MAAAAAFAEVDQCLQWIGFTDAQHRNSIIAEGQCKLTYRDG